MDTAAVTGAFTLGGVALGGGLNWLSGKGAERRAAAGQRDEAFAALVDACTKLGIEARTLRTLDTLALFAISDRSCSRPATAPPTRRG